MSALVGYQLISVETQEVVSQWGGIWGRCPGVPEILILPDNTQILAPELDVDYYGYTLIKWFMEPPAPVVSDISDRQFFQQAAIVGFITQQEALDAVKTGTIPAAMATIIDTLPDEASKFAANMLLSGATVFQRNHPMVETIRESLGKTPEEIDQFFLAAANL